MKEQFEAVIKHFEEELAGFHAGRVSPAIFEGLAVEAYNTMTPLNQLASITNQGAQMLIIQPWDSSALKNIERAIHASHIDCSPAVDGTTIRISFPPLTEEKRQSIVKIIKERAEECHIAIKRVREDVMNELKNKKNNKELSEDAFFTEQKKIQELVDLYNKKIKELTAAKEQEVLTI